MFWFFFSFCVICMFLADLCRRPPRPDRGRSHKQRHGPQVPEACGKDQAAAVCGEWRQAGCYEADTFIPACFNVVNFCLKHAVMMIMELCLIVFCLPAGGCLWFPVGQ